MNDEAGMKILQASQQLYNDTFHFWLGERFLEIVQ